jgi:ATP-dependent exoDNAse (exonuclease V) beta subunit
LDAVIDLAFKHEAGWVVVDFKTDGEDPGRLLKYRRQVGWYAYALDTITRQRTTGWLLHV